MVFVILVVVGVFAFCIGLHMVLPIIYDWAFSDITGCEDGIGITENLCNNCFKKQRNRCNYLLKGENIIKKRTLIKKNK